MPTTESKIQAAGGTKAFPLFAFWFLLLALIGLPRLGSAHGNEFLSARLDLLDGGSLIVLTISAEYGSNPMLPDRVSATQALQEVLHLEYSGQAHRLTDLAPMTLEQSTQSLETLPPSLTHADDGQEHQFMIAHWRWVPDVKEIAFSVPKGSLHDVLLWRQLPSQETQSILLLAGDVSKSIPVHPPQNHSRLIALIVAAALLVFSFYRFRRNRKA